MKISVITVCYNSAKTIAHTLRSVREQSYCDIEHIVVDGGSKDKTLEVIAAEGAHVAKLVSERDNGIYDAMNKGIALSSGEIIGFINSDDFYASPDALAKVAAVFADSDIDACYGDLCYVRENDTSAIVRYWRSADFRPGAFEVGWCPPHPTFFARRKIYERFGMFDLRFKIAADMELMMRFLEIHRVRAKYIPEVLVKMRMGGASNRNWIGVVKQNEEIWRAFRLHGVRSNMVVWICRKLLTKGLQFVMRPKHVVD